MGGQTTKGQKHSGILLGLTQFLRDTYGIWNFDSFGSKTPCAWCKPVSLLGHIANIQTRIVNTSFMKASTKPTNKIHIRILIERGFNSVV